MLEQRALIRSAELRCSDGKIGSLCSQLFAYPNESHLLSPEGRSSNASVPPPQPQRELEGEANKSVPGTAALRLPGVGGRGMAAELCVSAAHSRHRSRHTVYRGTGRALRACDSGFWATSRSQPRLVCTQGCAYLPQEQCPL